MGCIGSSLVRAFGGFMGPGGAVLGGSCWPEGGILEDFWGGAVDFWFTGSSRVCGSRGVVRSSQSECSEALGLYMPFPISMLILSRFQSGFVSEPCSGRVLICGCEWALGHWSSAPEAMIPAQRRSSWLGSVR